MKVSVLWLRDLVDLGDMSVDQIARTLTMGGLEVEEVTPVAPAFSGIVVAHGSVAAGNSYIFGILVIGFAWAALATMNRWEEWVELAIGIWLVISPFVLRFLAPAAHAAADGEWPMASRDYAGTRYSPLAQVTPQNAGQLKLAFSF